MSASETNMRKRVMVADDDSAVRESLRKVLEDNGYEVLLVEDGEAAVKGLANESIDLLLLDLQMPKLDSWDVFEAARSRCSLLPVIMMTGLATQLETRLIPGLDALLEKPIEMPVLLKKIQELLCESPNRRLEKLDSKLLSSRGLPKSTPGYLTFHPSDCPSHA
jgi:DNA-binding response OmpR family regulator